jgi:hypothetical protein
VINTMGLSIRAYARHRGVSHVAVKKAIDTGRISQLPDGTIDPVVADAQWAANTTPTRRSVADIASDKQAPQVSASARETPQTSAKLARETPEPPTPALSSGGTSLLQARTVNEVVKAQTNKVARAERDAWLNWPARISSQMAAGLGVDPHALHVALDAAVRQQLQDLGDLQAKVD